MIFDKLADEERDYKLSDEMHALAQELKQYKIKHGKYPETINAIRKTDTLCVRHVYTKCKKVHYQPSPDFQYFRMAMHSFSWPILFYHPQMSMSIDEHSKLTKEELNALTQKYGKICFYCFAYPPERTDLRGEVSTPIYRETSPFFANLQEWPEL